MQHVVNIAFDFDDEKVTKIAEAAIENDINSIIDKIISDHLAPERTFHRWGEDIRTRDWNRLSTKVDERIDVLLERYKDEIIEVASDKLVESYKRTKAWKDRAQEKLDKEDK